MRGLLEQLTTFLNGRVCVVGVGNVEQGDDALGMRLAEQLAAAGVEPVLFAGTQPERVLGAIDSMGCERVLFLDATECGGAPGSVVVLESDEITARYPQVSTHKLSLGLLARLIESEGHRKVCLLGVQPQSLGREVVLPLAADGEANEPLHMGIGGLPIAAPAHELRRDNAIGLGSAAVPVASVGVPPTDSRRHEPLLNGDCGTNAGVSGGTPATARETRAFRLRTAPSRLSEAVQRTVEALAELLPRILLKPAARLGREQEEPALEVSP